MRNKVIFNNYVSKCPNCGGDLDAEHKWCPYCGKNLQDINRRYRDGERVVVEAIDDFDEAQIDLEKRETQYKRFDRASFKKGPLIFLEIYFVYMLISMIVFIFQTDFFNHNVEKLKDEWRAQGVEIVEMRHVDIENIEFKNTSIRHPYMPEHIQESEDFLKLPFGLRSGLDECYIYVDRTGLKGLPRIKTEGLRSDRDPLYLDYEDFSMSIQVLDDERISGGEFYRYNHFIDYINFNPRDLNDAQRLNDVMLDGIVFEQYYISGSYYITTYLLRDYFVICEIYDYNVECFDIENAFKIVSIKTDFFK